MTLRATVFGLVIKLSLEFGPFLTIQESQPNSILEDKCRRPLPNRTVRTGSSTATARNGGYHIIPSNPMFASDAINLVRHALGIREQFRYFAQSTKCDICVAIPASLAGLLACRSLARISPSRGGPVATALTGVSKMKQVQLASKAGCRRVVINMASTAFHGHQEDKFEFVKKAQKWLRHHTRGETRLIVASIHSKEDMLRLANIGVDSIAAIITSDRNMLSELASLSQNPMVFDPTPRRTGKLEDILSSPLAMEKPGQPERMDNIFERSSISETVDRKRSRITQLEKILDISDLRPSEDDYKEFVELVGHEAVAIIDEEITQARSAMKKIQEMIQQPQDQTEWYEEGRRFAPHDLKPLVLPPGHVDSGQLPSISEDIF